MLSVIIPVYNRIENLEICLKSIAEQKGTIDEFEVIVVDDGSTDGLREKWSSLVDIVVKAASDIPIISVGYFSGGPNKGFRGGRARNIGAFNAGKNTKRFLFVDSDVVLNEYALQSYTLAHTKNPNAIIVGQYHWLPPLGWTDDTIHLLWEEKSLDALLDAAKALGVPQTRIDNDSPFGDDIRSGDFSEDLNAIRKGAGLGALSGNISYPKDLFWDLGGFDERIVGHGGEDADLGLTANSKETDWLFYKPIFGFHLWHARNQLKNHREVQANIAYIDAKHGVGQYAGSKKYTDAQDWSDPIHFHKHLGSSLIKTASDTQVYVYREDRYLKLSSPAWMVKLGFVWDDLEIVEQEFIARATHVGDTKDEQNTEPIPSIPNSQPKIEKKFFDHTKIRSYRKENGGAVCRVDGDQTVYAVRDDKRIAISHPDWLAWLGFTFSDVAVVPEYAFTGIEIVCSTPELTILLQGGALDV